MLKVNMSKESHMKFHEVLHRQLDLLVQDWINGDRTLGRRIHNATLLEFVEWSKKQCTDPEGHHPDDLKPLDIVDTDKEPYRADQNCICPICKLKYGAHRLANDLDNEGNKFLHVLCNGDRVKL